MSASSVSTLVAGQLSTRKDTLTVASGENNVADIDTTATNLDQVIINNNAGTAQIFVRIWALASGSVSLGSSVPIMILTAGAGETVEYSFAPAPVVETAMSAQVVQTNGYSATSTAVTWAVTVTFLTHD
jgi:hypothetical protein